MGRKLCLLDFKTSKAVYPSMWCQVHAYAKALEQSGNIPALITHTGILLIDKETAELKPTIREYNHDALMSFIRLAESFAYQKAYADANRIRKSSVKAARYTWQDKPVPSVTEILGTLDKSNALIPWAVNCCLDYLNDNKLRLEAAMDLIECNGDTQLLDVLFTEAKNAHRAIKEKAATDGTDGHEAIEMWLHSGGKMAVSECKNEVAANCLRAFLEWGDNVNLEVVGYEQEIFGWLSAADRLQGKLPLYAGRYDLLAYVEIG